MNVSNPRKTISKARMDCGGTATVTLTFQASAALSAEPADIILVMDRSSSMNSDRMTAARKAAKELIATVAAASSTAGAQMGNGTRMGLVSFADTATQDVALTEDTAALQTAVDRLVRGGYTNHKDAFLAAGSMLPPKGAKRQIVILFTDGVTTVGGSADGAARDLKAQGAEIFCIGLVTDPAQLNLWASTPTDTHVSYTGETAQLERVFREVAAEVVLAGGMDVAIRETLSPDFRIVKLNPPSDGVAEITGPHDLLWTMGAVGITQQPQDVTLSFEIIHIGTTGGILAVNQAITYEDRDGNVLDFPNPVVEVDCDGGVVFPEPCPAPTPILLEGCQDGAVVRLADSALQGLGRILQLDVTVKNVCPGKRVALALLLTELGANGEEFSRGIKTFTLPAQTGTRCQDVILRCIPFVLPEDLDVSGARDSLCSPRHFQARVLANYIDTDFLCCDRDTMIL